MSAVPSLPPPPSGAGAAALPDDLARASAVGQAVVANVERVVLGKDGAVRLAVAALVAGGHVLVEDVPGVGKTVLAKALARSLGGSFARVQGTPDLLPSDITGVTVYDQAEATWEFRPGPLFHHVVLVDEINRATPRAQSALLEAMAERQVTVDGTTHRLPDPCLVIATQNPLGDAGTFPLGDGQRDRFAVTVPLGLPDRSVERALLAGHGGERALDGLVPVTSTAELVGARVAVDRVFAAAPVLDHVLDLAAGTRTHPDVALGASPRAALMLLRVARATALLDGRGFVTPDDVKAVAPAVLGHRLVLHEHASLRPPAEVVAEVVAATPVGV